jgi:hypothetical protein
MLLKEYFEELKESLDGLIDFYLDENLVFEQ